MESEGASRHWVLVQCHRLQPLVALYVTSNTTRIDRIVVAPPCHSQTRDQARHHLLLGLVVRLEFPFPLCHDSQVAVSVEKKGGDVHLQTELVCHPVSLRFPDNRRQMAACSIVESNAPNGQAIRVHAIDPTLIASSLVSCTKRAAQQHPASECAALPSSLAGDSHSFERVSPSLEACRFYTLGSSW